MKKIVFALLALISVSNVYAYNLNVESEGKTQMISLTQEEPEKTIYFGHAYNYENEVVHDGNTLKLKLVNTDGVDKLNIMTIYQTVEQKEFSIDANPYNDDDVHAQLDESLKFVNQHGTKAQKVMYKKYYDDVTQPEIQTLPLPSIMSEAKYQRVSIDKVDNLDASVSNKTPSITINVVK